MNCQTYQIIDKLGFTPFSSTRKGLGNEAFPNWNPQSEFISDEEKQKFQGFLADGTSGFILLSTRQRLE